MSAVLDALFALVLAAGALSVGLPMLLNLTVQPAQNDAGAQVARMQVAAANYIRTMANVPNGIPAGTSVVTPATLQPIYLSARFTDSNVFGQKHILVVNNANGTIDGMVYTYGGTAMDDLTAIRVAQSGPADATVILANPSPNCANSLLTTINGNSVCFEGAAGGIALSATPYNPGAPYVIAPGHIGAYIEPMSNTPATPFISRGSTGNTADNTMYTALTMGGNNTAPTPIYMGGNNLTNAGTVTASGISASGDVSAAGSVYATTYFHLSDGRLKTNVTQIHHPFDLINSLQGHYFTWKADGRPDLGFIAQEVQAVLPEAVGVASDGIMAVKYDVLIAPLVEAVKEQQRQINALRAELAGQRKGTGHGHHK